MYVNSPSSHVPSAKACPAQLSGGAIILHGIRQNDFPLDSEGSEAIQRVESVLGEIVSGGWLIDVFLPLLDFGKN